MKCISCCREMEVEEERTDNPYVDYDIHVCDCGYSCERTFFGASDEPAEIYWFDDEGNDVDWEVEYERS